MPPNSLVLAGIEIFDIFFKGTSFDDLAKDGTVVKCDLKSDWDNIQINFMSVI